MAKLVTMFFILVAIQAVMILYVDPSEYNTIPIWDFLTNADNWHSTQFIMDLVAISLGIGLLGIAAGTVFGFKTDFLIFAGAIAGFIYMGIVFTDLSSFLRSELISMFYSSTCTLASCPMITWIIAVTIGPVAFYYVWTIVGWWRGGVDNY
jgi:hypothetical protein